LSGLLHDQHDLAARVVFWSSTPCASPRPWPSIFPIILFGVHHPVNQDDQHLLAHAMASDISVAWQCLSKRTIVFFPLLIRIHNPYPTRSLPSQFVARVCFELFVFFPENYRSLAAAERTGVHNGAPTIFNPVNNFRVYEDNKVGGKSGQNGTCCFKKNCIYIFQSFRICYSLSTCIYDFLLEELH
jgi:hypothetical protein